MKIVLTETQIRRIIAEDAAKLGYVGDSAEYKSQLAQRAPFGNVDIQTVGALLAKLNNGQSGTPGGSFGSGSGDSGRFQLGLGSAPAPANPGNDIYADHVGGDLSEIFPKNVPAVSGYDKIKDGLLHFQHTPYVWGNVDCCNMIRRAVNYGLAGDDSLGSKEYVTGWMCDVTYGTDCVPIDKSQLKAGDLCFVGTPNGPAKIRTKSDGTQFPVHLTHVAMYIGNGKIYHTNRTGTPPHISDLSDSYQTFGRLKCCS